MKNKSFFNKVAYRSLVIALIVKSCMSFKMYEYPLINQTLIVKTLTLIKSDTFYILCNMVEFENLNADITYIENLNGGITFYISCNMVDFQTSM